MRFPPTWDPKIIRYMKAALILLVISYMVFIEPYNLQTTENKFDFFIEDESTIKIVLIGDIHYTYDHIEYFQNIVNTINLLEPDVILIAGDVVDGMGERELENLEMLKPLESRYGTYAVLGNHDYFYRGCEGNCADKVEIELERIDVEVLRNEHRIINIRNRSFALVGLDDLWAGKSNYSKATENILELPRVILAHNQLSVLNKELEGRNIVLSAHTHCGYIWIPYVTDFVTKTIGFAEVSRGHLKIDGNTDLYVTCGVAPDIRLNNPPEISVIYLD